MGGLSVSETGRGASRVSILSTLTPFAVAVTFTSVSAGTGVVDTEKVPFVEPAGTVSVAGTVAELEELERFTTSPPVEAIPERVTVPVAFTPPVTCAGLIVTEMGTRLAESPAFRTCNVPFAETLLMTAVTVTVLDVSVFAVAALKVIFVEPAGTVILAGSVTIESPLVSATTAPPTGATPFSTTVPLELLPPTTDVGASVTDTGARGKSCKVAVDTAPFADAASVVFMLTATPNVAMVNVTELVSAGTRTVAGGTAFRLSLASVTTIPPVGAFPDRVTLPFALVPPTTTLGVIVNESADAGKSWRLPFAVAPPEVAVTVTAVCVVTAVVCAVKVTEVAPLSTVTVAGSVTAALSLTRFTIRSPAGA